MSSPLGLLKPSIQSHTIKDGLYTSIFNQNKFYYRPVSVSNGSMKSSKVYQQRSIGNDSRDTDIFNTSTQSIINYCDRIPAMKLKFSDFMYLKDFGVYPNNRLVVIRRFPYGVDNDLTAIPHTDFSVPLATIVTWIPEGEKMLSFSFGEKWQEATTKDPIALFDTVFKGVLPTTAGGMFSGIGDAATKVFGNMGVAEALQFQLLKELGATSEASWENLPQGNPNFITDAKERVREGGLTSDISFQIKVSYEQKFIANIDPTIVFLDLLNNILRFGSSESSFYITGGNSRFKELVNAFTTGNWAKGAGMIISSFVTAIQSMISGVKDSASALIEKAKQMANQSEQDDKDARSLEFAKKKEQEAIASGDVKAQEEARQLRTTIEQKQANKQKTTALTGFTESLSKAIDTIGTVVISKYRIQIASVINSMTGRPSTPWHITIGNPKKPIFSSGDMLVQDVNVELGEVLMYNDLPSTIDVTFKISSARALGIQEIFDRFNVGGARTYQKTSYQNERKDFFEQPLTEKYKKEQLEQFNAGKSQQTPPPAQPRQ